MAAVDPSPPFVAATRERLPGVAVARAGAERLPFVDRTFDRVLAQLVVPFLADPAAGLVEMVRVGARAGWSRRARGTTREAAARCRCSGGRSPTSTPLRPTSPRGRAPRRASWRRCSRPPGCARCTPTG